MDPPSIDPPPVPAATTTQQVAAPAPIATPTPTPPPAAQHHPPYAEMITAAITALDEREGSSKRAIAKYIEAHYTSLPPTHDSLLTTHLKRLKTNGQLQMVKHSYTLPRSAPAIAPLVSTAAANGSDVPKRRPGRPPKLKPAADAVQPAVPVFPAPAPFSLANNSVPPVNPAAPPQAVFVASPTGSVNGPAAPAGPPTRGRGRPPLKRGRGRPPKNTAASGPTVAPAVVSASGGSGRGRGRPRKNVAPTGDVGVGSAQQAAAAATTPVAKGLGRPRGRPPKPINVAPVAVPAQPAAASVVVGVKRRGRPPKAGVGASAMQQQQAKRPRKLSGKPLGRPRKDTAANVNPTPDSQLLVSYLDMKAKLDNLHSRIQQTVTIVKPCLDNEAAINALQELEIVAAANVSAPPSAQSQPPLPQPQPEQPLVQPPQVQS